MAFKLIILTSLLATVFAYPQHGHHTAVSHQTIHLTAPSHHAAGPIYHAAAAAPVYHAAPVAVHHAAPILKTVYAEPETPANYQFEYSVHDPHTGDVKEQKETNHDGQVEGYYSLIDADGTKRTVHYTADKHNGFNAVVSREGKAVHPQVAVKAVAPVIYKAAAPAYHHGGYSSHY